MIVLQSGFRKMMSKVRGHLGNTTEYVCQVTIAKRSLAVCDGLGDMDVVSHV